jgi:hypothetical protein
MTTLPTLPVLAAAPPRIVDGQIELTLGEHVYVVEHTRPDELMALLSVLDGQHGVDDLPAASGLSRDEVAQALTHLDAGGFLDDHTVPAVRSASDVCFAIEDELNRLFSEQIETSRFWQELSERPETVPHNVYYGMAIENWHFLYREHLFDSAVLSFPNSREVRSALNEFYIEEHRHDDIVLKAFEPLGITPDQMRAGRPLPSTMALVNGLAWWARTDPLFFLATVSVLEGGPGAGEDGTDSFLEAADRASLPEPFVGPLREHARINAGHGHGRVSRELFDLLPAVNDSDEARMRAQCSLFMELYRNFYDGIWEHWSDPSRPLLRSLPHPTPEVTA